MTHDPFLGSRVLRDLVNRPAGWICVAALVAALITWVLA